MYDKITEVTKKYDEIEHVTKFNPFHDAKGRFSNKRGFASYSADPDTKAGAMAIARSLAAGHVATKNKHKNSGSGNLVADGYYINNGDHAKAALASAQKWQNQKAKQQAQQTAQQAAPAKPKATKPKQAKPKQDDAQQDNGAKDQVAVNTKTQKAHKDWTMGDVASDEVNKRIAKDTNTDVEKAKLKKAAVLSYSMGDSGDIRDAAKHIDDKDYVPTKYNENKYIEQAKQIEDFIASSEKWDGGELMRGIGVDKATAQKIIQQANDGELLDMRGPSSWSTNPKIAESFSKMGVGSEKIIFHIGGKANGTSIRHLSAFTGEDEVLLSKNARFEADIIQQKDGAWHIYGREVSLD